MATPPELFWSHMKIVLRWHGASFCASKIDPARVTSYQGNSSYPLFLPKRLCGTKSCVWTSAHCAIVGSTSLHGMIFSELRSYAEDKLGPAAPPHLTTKRLGPD